MVQFSPGADTRPTDDQPALDILGNGRYFDRFERRAGEWRIARRQVIFRAGRADPVNNGWEHLLPPPGPGTRDRSDLTYRRTT